MLKMKYAVSWIEGINIMRNEFIDLDSALNFVKFYKKDVKTHIEEIPPVYETVK